MGEAEEVEDIDALAQMLHDRERLRKREGQEEVGAFVRGP